MPDFQLLLSGVGVLLILSIFLRLFNFARPYLKKSNLHHYLCQDSYALISGSTDGIGKSTALALADFGFNIVLHGRNPEKLNAVKAEIVKKYPACKVVGIIHDAASGTAPDVSSLRSLLITVLINNVGGGLPQKFDQTTQEDLQKIINWNAVFAVHLTRALLPLMPRPTLIINITSYVAFLPPPFIAMYSASKAFNNAFSSSLSRELENVECISMITGSVHSAGNTKPVSFMRPHSDDYAKKILQAVGCGTRSLFPYWPHAIQTYLMGLIPDSILGGVMKKAIAHEFEQQNSGK
jgi:17beta-estradiol 17-dehydrogenase / very-long-chain 3-oxoacyl-CoA reductase